VNWKGGKDSDEMWPGEGCSYAALWFVMFAFDALNCAF